MKTSVIVEITFYKCVLFFVFLGSKIHTNKGTVVSGKPCSIEQYSQTKGSLYALATEYFKAYSIFRQELMLGSITLVFLSKEKVKEIFRRTFFMEVYRQKTGDTMA